jgi:hypothetical protein
MQVGSRRWAPLTVEEATSLLANAPLRWWISGGHALELYMGERWRTHEDLDIGICRRDAGAVHSWLQGWEGYVAAGGQLSRWDGRELHAGRHENNVWFRRPSDETWAFDLTVNEGNQHKWIYRRDHSVTRPWDSAVRVAQSGIPYLAPELQLLFKSKGPRGKDHVDAEQVIPALGHLERLFLVDHLDAGHPWRNLLQR